jgi:hypothetical protein
MELLIAFAVALGANFAVLYVLQRRYEPALYRVVALTYLGTLGLRFALAVLLWLYHDQPGFATMFWGDSGTYDALGASVAEGWRQGASSTAWTGTVEGQVNRGFIYFVACVYYIFGRNTLMVQLLNCTIGALTPIVILEIGMLIYHRRVASRAMMFAAFFPQMIFWSAAMYKDAAVMLFIAFTIYAVLRLKQRFSPFTLLIYVVSTAALIWLRFYIFYAVMAATLAGFVIGSRRGPVFALFSQMALVSSVIVLLLFTPAGQEMVTQARFLDLERLQVSRNDLAQSANSGFAVEADVSTPSGLVRLLPLGVAYLLFAPFPWTVGSLRQALALPDILVWYALMPALVRGLLSAVRHRLNQTMPILVFTTGLTLAYAAFLGNAGTAYRQRTQIMMFYFLFIADGLSRGVRHDEETTENAEAGALSIP